MNNVQIADKEYIVEDIFEVKQSPNSWLEAIAYLKNPQNEDAMLLKFVNEPIATLHDGEATIFVRNLKSVFRQGG